jgi:hypothetical protein
MNVKRKLLSAAAGAAMIPIFLVALPAGTASAHGYIFESAEQASTMRLGHDLLRRNQVRTAEHRRSQRTAQL